jgi:transposase
MKYIRTCQECGHKQEAKDTKTYKGESWRNLKCKKCKSEALDYGSWRECE